MMDVGYGIAIQTQSTCKIETHAQYIGGERQQYPCMIRIHWQLFRRIVAFFIKSTLVPQFHIPVFIHLIK